MQFNFTDWWDSLFSDEKDRFEVDIEQVRGACRDYILIMLGAPVIKIELDDLQLSGCVSLAQDLLSVSDRVNPKYFSILMQQLSLAFAKIVLGRIRSKFTPSPTGDYLDGQVLLDEGHSELYRLQDKLGLL